MVVSLATSSIWLHCPDHDRFDPSATDLFCWKKTHDGGPETWAASGSNTGKLQAAHGTLASACSEGADDVDCGNIIAQQLVSAAVEPTTRFTMDPWIRGLGGRMAGGSRDYIPRIEADPRLGLGVRTGRTWLIYPSSVAWRHLALRPFPSLRCALLLGSLASFPFTIRSRHLLAGQAFLSHGHYSVWLILFDSI